MIMVIEDSGQRVWINPAHVIWFWDFCGQLCIALTGRDDMLCVGNMDAACFADLLETEA